MSYSPTLMRFVQPDPIGYVDGPNLYPFVKDNPINLVDPEGLNGRPPLPLDLPKLARQLWDRAAAWKAQGWKVAARNLEHFMFNTGTNLEYNADEVQHIRGLKSTISLFDWAIRAPERGVDDLVVNDLDLKARGANGPQKVKGHLNPRFESGELFYAFGGMLIDYEGEINCIAGTGYGYKVKVDISDFYNFTAHSSFDSLFSDFDAAVKLQNGGWAKPYWNHATWNLEGKRVWVGGRNPHFQ